MRDIGWVFLLLGVVSLLGILSTRYSGALVCTGAYDINMLSLVLMLSAALIGGAVSTALSTIGFLDRVVVVGLGSGGRMGLAGSALTTIGWCSLLLGFAHEQYASLKLTSDCSQVALKQDRAPESGPADWL